MRSKGGVSARPRRVKGLCVGESLISRGVASAERRLRWAAGSSTGEGTGIAVDAERETESGVQVLR